MTVEEIKERFSIKEELQARGVEVNRAGFCRCIFHEEKTPSMKIYPNNSFHCFGCGKSGDVISVIMQLDSLDFQSACKSLSGGSLSAASRKHINLKQMAREEKGRKEKRKQDALRTIRKRIDYYESIKKAEEPMSDKWADAVNKLELEYYRESAILDGDYQP